jgi:methanogenic corrinoid protein MtbC1
MPASNQNSHIPAEAGQAFGQALQKLVVFVNDKFGLDNRFACRDGACRHMETAREFTRLFGNLLHGIYSFDITHLLAPESTALIMSLEARGIRQDSVIALVQAWVLAIECLVKRAEAERLVPPLQQLLHGLPAIYADMQRQPDALSPDVQPFFDLLMTKNRKFAAEHILSRMREGATIEQAYETVLLPALERMRLLWLHNRITAADEQTAADICRYVMLRVIDSIFGERRYPYKVLVACMPGGDSLEAEVLANFLSIKGWSVSFLGAGIPLDDILYALLKNTPQAVVLSTPSIAGLPETRSLTARIREKHPRIITAVHGRAALLIRDRLAGISDLVASGLEQSHGALLKEVLGRA